MRERNSEAGEMLEEAAAAMIDCIPYINVWVKQQAVVVHLKVVHIFIHPLYFMLRILLRMMRT